MKIRIIKSNVHYRLGEVVEVTPNIGFGLIDAGYARADKMFTESPVVKRKAKR